VSRVAWIDAAGGIAGDMLLAAALDAAARRDGLEPAPFAAAFLAGLIDRLRLPGVAAAASEVRRGGFRGLHLDVRVDSSVHAHGRTLGEVEGILAAADLADRVRERAARVFRTLVAAEARAHGLPADATHLHEAGAADALVDVVGVVEGLERLAIDRIVCSALPMGSGTVRCAHGELPLPAPAVACLLEGVPVRPAGTEGETVTPTGAALAVALSERFAPMPAMTVGTLGVGAGARDRPGVANLLRLFVGVAAAEAPGPTAAGERLVEANIDDMAPDLVAHLLDRLLESGAADAFVTPIVMKKGRPAHRISALCGPERLDGVLGTLFRESTTIGCRLIDVDKRALDRIAVDVVTPWGPVPVKVAWYRGEVVSRKPEHDACVALARSHGVPLRKVVEAAAAAAVAAVPGGTPEDASGTR
jgi:uncharacterized protein (TIGR00299 family) protein